MLPEPLFLSVHMYGIMVAVGILCAFIVFYYFAYKKKVEKSFTDFIFYNAIASIVIGFLSASLFQSLYDYIERLKYNPEAKFKFSGSITFIGGLIGGVIFFMLIYFVFRKRYKTRLYEVVYIIPPSILIAHAFGRIGCFFAGCCHGKPTDSILGVKFPRLPQPVHPTQLYESAFLFILFAVCSYLVLKKDFKHTLSVYLISYGVFRFLIEYLRGDDRGELLGILSPSQFWSVLMILAGVGLIFLIRYNFKKKNDIVKKED